MAEQIYNIRQDVFGVLVHMPKAALEIWSGILMRVFPDGQGPIRLPRKLWADARKLVEAGIAIEPAEGEFSANPDVVFMSVAPSLDEIQHEANS